MGCKAIDVVLLPDEGAAGMAVAANRRLVEGFGEKIVLDKENCLPHISLAMGCIDDGDIMKAAGVLERIAGRYGAMELVVSGVAVEENRACEKVSAFEVEKANELQALHEEIMGELGVYLSNEVTAEMIYPSGEVGVTTLEWIANYREKSSFGRFWPHITLGYGAIEGLEYPSRISGRELALCHLGNHCTCREVLLSFGLGD